MSHIVTVRTQVRDASALAAACGRIGLALPEQGTARLFSTEAAGQIVRLPGWNYPVVIDITTGAIAYDNYGGSWGDPRHLDHLLQFYAVEKARIEARKAGHSVTEQALADGSIKLTVQAGAGIGGAA